MGIHADLLTAIQHRTSGAARQLTRADVLTKRHQQLIDFYPIVVGQFGLKGCHRLLWRARMHVAPAICYPVDVDIDTNAWLVAGNTQH